MKKQDTERIANNCTCFKKIVTRDGFVAPLQTPVCACKKGALKAGHDYLTIDRPNMCILYSGIITPVRAKTAATDKMGKN